MEYKPQEMPTEQWEYFGCYLPDLKVSTQSRLPLSDKQIGFGVSWESLEDFQQKIR